MPSMPACPPISNRWRVGHGRAKVELPDGDVRRQHWWSASLTQVKAAALLEAATGRDVPRLETQRAWKAGGWLSAPPSGGPGPLPGNRQLLHTVEVASGRAPTTGGLRGRALPPVWRAGGHFRRPRRVMQEVGVRGQAPWHSIRFLPGPYPSPDPAWPRGERRREWSTPSGRPADGIGRKTGPRGGSDHCPPDFCHRPAPARQRPDVPQGRGGTEEPRECRLVWADECGLLPDGVRHLGRLPRGRKGRRIFA